MAGSTRNKILVTPLAYSPARKSIPVKSAMQEDLQRVLREAIPTRLEALLQQLRESEEFRKR